MSGSYKIPGFTDVSDMDMPQEMTNGVLLLSCH
jgi:hypothetical protein